MVTVDLFGSRGTSCDQVRMGHYIKATSNSHTVCVGCLLRLPVQLGLLAFHVPIQRLAIPGTLLQEAV